ncbi:hypothetical protein B0T16DRAFT_416905 [Cercophora newfieldiana]|uniref:Uncharacterized protein n=1 Tax=Cercophora newfieldiana TaxID=92897 RepID=A0AA39Y1Z6_9PEZI|nr:hypothetical protein B0T16DRAFT_416905 [Cercophora newfieldiana]
MSRISSHTSRDGVIFSCTCLWYHPAVTHALKSRVWPSSHLGARPRRMARRCVSRQAGTSTAMAGRENSPSFSAVILQRKVTSLLSWLLRGGMPPQRDISRSNMDLTAVNTAVPPPARRMASSWAMSTDISLASSWMAPRVWPAARYVSLLAATVVMSAGRTRRVHARAAANCEAEQISEMAETSEAKREVSNLPFCRREEPAAMALKRRATCW